MNYIVINGAPGVGKSSLLDLLQDNISDGYALIDGDELARTVPLENNVKWLNLMQDNILACIENFKKYGIKSIIISFVFPNIERLNRLKNLLKNNEDKFIHIVLNCQQDVLKKRLHKRNKQRLVTIKQALICNRKISKLNCDYNIDTTEKRLSPVLNSIIEILAIECD